jgi:putative SOS response-associated peptidase YedK
MCGRFTLIRLSDFTDLFPWIRDGGVVYDARYNIAPSQVVPAVPNDGKNTIGLMQWGLVPFWAKDVSIGNKMINARAETLLEKPAFKKLSQRRRCVIPASGFYEWKQEPGSKTKTPMHIRLRNRPAFGLAGLWDVWHGGDGSELHTCTIITTGPNELMRPIHNRMPAILDEAGMRIWLTPGELAQPPIELLKPFDAEQMEAYPVSRNVNAPANEGPSLIDVCEPPPPVPGRAPAEQPGLFG